MQSETQTARPVVDLADPGGTYTRCRSQHDGARTRLLRQRNRVLLLLSGLLTLFLALAFSPVRALASRASHPLGQWLPATLLVAWFIACIVRYLRLQYALEQQDRLLHLYDVALARTSGAETQSGRHGAPPPSGHLFARDLDLFGPASLFGLLATVRTTVGEVALARYLTEAVPQPESVARQQAVRELAPQVELRERIALLGGSELDRISAGMVEEWLDAAPPVFAHWLRPALFCTATVALVLLVRPGLLGLHPWSAGLPWLLLVLLLQAALCARARQPAAELLAASLRLQRSLRLVREGLALLDGLTLTAPKLAGLQRQAREPAGAVRQLDRLLNLLAIAEQRGQQYFLPLSLVTAAGMQTAISLAAWKRAHAAGLRVWVAAWGEFEALNALATYAFEHPEDAWPDLLPVGEPACFEARTFGHPLLAGAVRNDVHFNPQTPFYLISGSNMAGKSTLLRAIGINAVLAYAGAPVRAASLRLTPFTLGASLALTDSLAEGKSKFLAEVERLAAIVAASRSSSLLFLVDEIFSGTNSADRRTAAEAVLRTLLEHGAMGALSTHDLALTELAHPGNGGRNVHMASPDESDPLAFDYRLKDGINRTSNALAIVRLLGLAGGAEPGAARVE